MAGRKIQILGGKVDMPCTRHSYKRLCHPTDEYQITLLYVFTIHKRFRFVCTYYDEQCIVLYNTMKMKCRTPSKTRTHTKAITQYCIRSREGPQASIITITYLRWYFTASTTHDNNKRQQQLSRGGVCVGEDDDDDDDDDDDEDYDNHNLPHY